MTEAEQRMADRLRREATAIMDTHPGASAAMQLAADFLDQCAEAEPVAWRVECRWTDRSKGGDWRKYADYGTEQAAASSQQVFAKPGDIESRIVPLFTHPAPAAPQAEPCIGNDPICPCQDGDACHYKDGADGTKAWSVPQAEPKLGELMLEQRRSRIVAGAYPDGNPNAGAIMAQTSQAEPKREPLSDAQLASVCLSYRHDFGLLNKDEQARLMLEARDWERAFRKEWQREPLSDDDINKLAWKQNIWTDGMVEFSFLAFARAVERAHGIGGGGSDAE